MRVGVSFDLFIDRPHVAQRLSKWQKMVLARIGGYGRTTMRRSIRAPRKGKKFRTVQVGRISCVVPVRGRVLDAKTQQPVSKRIADQARLAMRSRERADGAGKPPRRGPTDLLRKFILFSVAPESESVVVGAMPFARQPSISGASSIPELLDRGGSQIINGENVKYAARPFVQRALEPAHRRMAEIIRANQLGE